MPSVEKNVRVFISSTFRDMHAERDHLVTVVFPELRERVERLGLEFFDVDLRWGVPAKDANGETANSWEYCRQWIDRVEPFFVCILGQRYGWEPEPEQLKDPADRQRQQDHKRSITDMEVRHAVLNSRQKRRSYFYFRTAEAPASATKFVDPPPLQVKLDELKKEIRSCGRPVRTYPCRWTGEGFAGLEQFGELVLEDLWSGVLRDQRYVRKEVWRQVLGADPDTDALYADESRPIPLDLWKKIVDLAKPEPKEPLEAEREQMDAFASSRLRWFQGRTHELQQLTDFLSTTAADAPSLAVVAAVPGQGKSALLAKLHQQLKASSHFVITHFVGATEHSASAYSLVDRLVGELDRSGIAWPSEQQGGQEPKRDFNSLCLRLAQRLGDYAGERRIVILLDALNQLSDGHDLHWLPARPGPSVRVIVSCIEDTAAKADSPEPRVLNALALRRPAPLRVPLGPLTEQDVRTIVVAYLNEYCKVLDTVQVDAICALPQARNPLYLLVMLGELRALGGDDKNQRVPTLIAELPSRYPDTPSLFRWVLQRMEVFGSEAMRWWCLYVGRSRAGMASRELAELLGRKLGVEATASALRIERGLRRYLQRRGAQLDFFHSQLREAVFAQYGPQADRSGVHWDIAAYFLAQDDFLEAVEEQRARAHRLPRTARKVNRRKVEEVLYQSLSVVRSTTREVELDRACTATEALLTDLHFLEAKTESDLVFELADDYSQAIEALPKTRAIHQTLCWLEKAIRRDIHFVARHTTTLFQCLWNSCWWHDSPAASRYEMRSASEAAEGGGEQSETALHKLLEVWRSKKELQTPGFVWMRSLRPPPDSLDSRLKGVLTASHKHKITCLASSADGKHLVSGSSYGNVQVWNVDASREEAVCSGHEHNIHSVAYREDGKLVASASLDRSVRVWDSSSGVELRRFGGHELRMRTMAIRPGEKAFLLGGADGTVRTWDLNSGQELMSLQAHDYPVNRVAYSPDGWMLASCGNDRQIRIWQADTGKRLLQVAIRSVLFGRMHDWIAHSATFSPNGRFLYAGGGDGPHGFLGVWDVETGAELAIWEGHERPVESVAISPDGRFLASGDGDGSVKLWDAQEFKLRRSLDGHIRNISCVRFSPNGKLLASAEGGMYVTDPSIRIWDVATGSELQCMKGHYGSIGSIDFSPDGSEICSCSQGDTGFRKDNTVRFWNCKTGAELHSIAGHSGPVNEARYFGGGSRILSVSSDETARIWDRRSCEQLKQFSLPGHLGNSVDGVTFAGKQLISWSKLERTIRVWDVEVGRETECYGLPESYDHLAFSSDGEFLLTSDFSRSGTRIEMWDWRLRSKLWSNEIPEGWFESAMAFSADGRRIAFGSHDAPLRIWESGTGEFRVQTRPIAGTVKSVAFSPDGRYLVSGGDDRMVRIWNAYTGEEVIALDEHDAEIEAVVFLADNRTVVSAGDDGRICVLDIGGPQKRNRPPGSAAVISSVVCSQASRQAVSGSEAGEVLIWDVETGEARPLEGHAGDVTSVDLSRDGRKIISGSADQTACIWSAVSGRLIHQLQAQGPCKAVRFSHSGELAACGLEEGGIHVWDTISGQQKSWLYDHKARFQSMAWFPDGRRLVSSGGWDDNIVRIWDVRKGECILSIECHCDIYGVAVSADGTRIAGGAQDQHIKIWNAATGAQLGEMECKSSLIWEVACSKDDQRIAGRIDAPGMLIYDAGTMKKVRAFYGAGDTAANTEMPVGYGFRAFGAGVETYVVDDRAVELTAWFPESLDVRQMGERTIVSAVGRHFYILQIEGRSVFQD